MNAAAMTAGGGNHPEGGGMTTASAHASVAGQTGDDAPLLELPLLELRGISKSFPGVKALDDV